MSNCADRRVARLPLWFVLAVMTTAVPAWSVEPARRPAANVPPAAPSAAIAPELLPIVGRVDLGNTTYGLCGGMVFAALDSFSLGVPAPDVPTSPPASGTSLRSYLSTAGRWTACATTTGTW